MSLNEENEGEEEMEVDVVGGMDLFANAEVGVDGGEDFEYVDWTETFNEVGWGRVNAADGHIAKLRINSEIKKI